MAQPRQVVPKRDIFLKIHYYDTLVFQIPWAPEKASGRSKQLLTRYDWSILEN